MVRRAATPEREPAVGGALAVDHHVAEIGEHLPIGQPDLLPGRTSGSGGVATMSEYTGAIRRRHPGEPALSTFGGPYHTSRADRPAVRESARSGRRSARTALFSSTRATESAHRLGEAAHEPARVNAGAIGVNVAPSMPRRPAFASGRASARVRVPHRIGGLGGATRGLDQRGSSAPRLGCHPYELRVDTLCGGHPAHLVDGVAHGVRSAPSPAARPCRARASRYPAGHSADTSPRRGRWRRSRRCSSSSTTHAQVGAIPRW